MSQFGTHRPYDTVKRGIDIVVSAFGLALTAPLQAVIAGIVLRKLGRPVFFRQQRPGRGGEPFVMVKFRTMRALDPEVGLVSDADRLTPFGRKLRATSLDELPTLWNVLRGDMSLVGPRPLLMQYLERYTPEQARRHEVRPGITGSVQVSGRNLLSWDEKFRIDVQYIDRRSFALDAKLLARTLLALIRQDGIAAPDAHTMPEFFGTGSK